MSPTSLATLLVRQNPLDGVRNTFSSWDSCMAKGYCKWPVIVAIIIGSLIVLSILMCVARFCCCGVECCCACCSCINSCCPSPKKKGRSKSAGGYGDYPSNPNPGPQGYGYQAPMNYGFQQRAMPQQFAPQQFAPGFASPIASPKYAAPQFATFESPSKPAITEDSLLAMPSWDTAATRRVEDTSYKAQDDAKDGQSIALTDMTKKRDEQLYENPDPDPEPADDPTRPMLQPTLPALGPRQGSRAATTSPYNGDAAPYGAPAPYDSYGGSRTQSPAPQAPYGSRYDQGYDQPLAGAGNYTSNDAGYQSSPRRISPPQAATGTGAGRYGSVSESDAYSTYPPTYHTYAPRAQSPSQSPSQSQSQSQSQPGFRSQRQRQYSRDYPDSHSPVSPVSPASPPPAARPSRSSPLAQGQTQGYARPSIDSNAHSNVHGGYGYNGNANADNSYDDGYGYGSSQPQPHSQSRRPSGPASGSGPGSGSGPAPYGSYGGQYGDASKPFGRGGSGGASRSGDGYRGNGYGY